MAITFVSNALAPHIGLTNGNLTATVQGSPAPSDYESVFSTLSRSTGKLYFEVHVDSEVLGQDIGIGVGNASALGSEYAGESGNSLGLFDDGRVYNNNANIGVGASGPTFTGGNYVGVAIDVPNKRLWYRAIKSLAATNWNHTPSPTSDPATGVNGIDISMITGAIFPMVTLITPGDRCTINFGATAFVAAAPTGFVGFNVAASIGLAAGAAAALAHGHASQAHVSSTEGLLGSVGRYAIGQEAPGNALMFLAGGYGEANFIGTTEFISLIESMRAKMAYSVRMEVTKL